MAHNSKGCTESEKASCTNASTQRAYGHLVRNYGMWCTSQLVKVKGNIPHHSAASEEALCTFCLGSFCLRSFCLLLVEQCCPASLLVNSNRWAISLSPAMGFHSVYQKNEWPCVLEALGPHSVSFAADTIFNFVGLETNCPWRYWFFLFRGAHL